MLAISSSYHEINPAIRHMYALKVAEILNY